MREAITTDKEKRLREEQVLREKGENIPFPGWERLTDEAIEMNPKVFITVRDLEGRAVRRLVGPASPGIHRINWDLRLPPPDSIDLSVSGFQPPWVSPKKGPFASPGSYQVEMAIVDSSGAISVCERPEFEVKAVPGMVLPEPDYRVVALFQSQTSDLVRLAEGVLVEIRGAQSRLRHMKEALIETPRVGAAIFSDIEKVEVLLEDLRGRLVGDRIRSGLNEATAPSILSRLGRISSNHWETRQEPTVTQRKSLEIAQRNLEVVKNELASVLDVDITNLEEELAKSGAPWTPGRKLR